jgi:hypothetical protein
MLCNHDDQRCEVCTSCRLCFPHTVGYRDGETIQGGCRDADLRRRLDELDVLERGGASILARARETGNADNERGARDLLEQIARDRDRMLGTDGL